jgi:formamidopyrimidine-DNA glycosylase
MIYRFSSFVKLITNGLKKTNNRRFQARARQFTVSRHRRAQQKFLAVPETNAGALNGRKIENVTAVGKHIPFALDNDAYLHKHLRVFGRWRIHPFRAAIPRDPRIMEIIRTDRYHAVLLGGSVLELLRADELAKHQVFRVSVPMY